MDATGPKMFLIWSACHSQGKQVPLQGSKTSVCLLWLCFPNSVAIDTETDGATVMHVECCKIDGTLESEGPFVGLIQIDSGELDYFVSIVVGKLEELSAVYSEDEEDKCEMCEREMRLTRHHLIPKLMHARYKAKGFTREELNTCALICRVCHSAVHHFFSGKELAQKYNTIEKLLEVSFEIATSYCSSLEEHPSLCHSRKTHVI